MSLVLSTKFSVGDLVWPLGAEPSLLTYGMLNTYFLSENGAITAPSVVVEVLSLRKYKIRLPSGRVVEVADSDLSRTRP